MAEGTFVASDEPPPTRRPDSERTVRRSHQIGESNDTGLTTGPHLHYDYHGRSGARIRQLLMAVVRHGRRWKKTLVASAAFLVALTLAVWWLQHDETPVSPPVSRGTPVERPVQALIGENRGSVAARSSAVFARPALRLPAPRR